MKIYSDASSSSTRYPSWSVFTKLWKNTIFPVLKKNLTIESYEHVSSNEDYILSVTDVIDDRLISNLYTQVKQALEAKGFIVEQYNDELIMRGKSYYSPEITIAIFKNEPDDDTILYGYDDHRWNSPSQTFDDMTFNPSYQSWLDDRGLSDTADEISRAPKAVQRNYCDWVRSITNEIAIVINYAE